MQEEEEQEETGIYYACTCQICKKPYWDSTVYHDVCPTCEEQAQTIKEDSHQLTLDFPREPSEYIL